jgi:hypothetical protein
MCACSGVQAEREVKVCVPQATRPKRKAEVNKDGFLRDHVTHHARGEKGGATYIKRDTRQEWM